VYNGSGMQGMHSHVITRSAGGQSPDLPELVPIRILAPLHMRALARSLRSLHVDSKCGFGLHLQLRTLALSVGSSNIHLRRAPNSIQLK
jgi:hypothetical protein